MIYKNLYKDADPLLQPTLDNPRVSMSFETYCKKLEISTTTDDIHQTKVFAVNVQWFLEFVERLDPNTFLTSEIKSRINAGKALLVLNHSHERTHLYSNPFYEHSWSRLFKKLESSGIDLNRIVFLSGDRNIEEIFKEKGNDLNVIGIDSLEFIYNEWISKHKIPKTTNFSLDKEKDFLFLNAVPREHRCVLRYLLKKEKLLRKSINSWVIGDNQVKIHDIVRFIERCHLNISAKDVFLTSITEKKLDTEYFDLRSKGTQNVLHPAWLEKTCFSFAVETDYVNDVLLISEKTYKPIVFMHPFMVYSHPNHLKHLQDCGYETYPEMFDESYDYQTDDDKIRTIINNLKTFKDRAAGKEKIINEKIIHNQQHFLRQPCAEKTKQKLLELFE